MIESEERLGAIAADVKRHLLDDIIAYWEGKTRDPLYYGFLTEFDREGLLTAPTKNMWMQGRQVWMFSALHRYVQPQVSWLDLAGWGREFIMKNGYAGNGRWHYVLDRFGKPLQGPTSIFADMFVLQGLCEYSLAVGYASADDFDRISATFDSIERRILSEDLTDIEPQKYVPGMQKQGVYMICLNMISTVRKYMGEERIAKLRDYCLDKIMGVFLKREELLLYESLDMDGHVKDTAEGRLINPGHTFESMWFCMEEGIRLGRKDIVQLAANAVESGLLRSLDPEYGGLLYMLDAKGDTPVCKDWIEARDLKWNEKVWWTHAEALYALLLAAVATDNRKLFLSFQEIYGWCRRHFHDSLYGEWYYALQRDGTPRLLNKGGLQKACFHLPRALMKIYLLLEHGLSENKTWYKSL